jgi:hypothetical protein
VGDLDKLDQPVASPPPSEERDIPAISSDGS